MNIERPKSKQPLPDDAKKVFSGVMFDVYQWEQTMFDGTKAKFEKLKRPDTVVVFPVLPDGRILFTEQEQPGKEPFIGATGGRVDAGEDILAAAKRELLEESGYEADHFMLWDAQQPVSKIEWAVYTFIAKGIRKIADLHLDAGEKIVLKPVTFDEMIALAGDSRFGEKEVSHKFMEAKYDPVIREELRKLFDPTIL
jgi:ADP-ribose pyrophosphatase